VLELPIARAVLAVEAPVLPVNDVLDFLRRGVRALPLGVAAAPAGGREPTDGAEVPAAELRLLEEAHFAGLGWDGVLVSRA
jgi:hypothetical protein